MEKLIISDKNSEYIRFIERLLPNLFCMNMHSLAKPLIVENATRDRTYFS